MILTGLARLGRDAILRYSADGTPVANLALAYNYGQRGSNGNRSTQWVEAALWGKRAESLTPHLLKGTAVDIVVEDVRIDTWQDNDGASRAKLVGRVITIEFAGRSTDRAPTRESDEPAPAAREAAFESDDVPF